MRLYDDNVPPEQSLPAATQLETPSAPVYTIYYNKIQKTQVLKTSTIAGIEHLHVVFATLKQWILSLFQYLQNLYIKTAKI